MMRKRFFCSFMMLLALATMQGGSVRNAHFYQRLLEDFCKAYFSEMFENRSYVYTSLYVESVNVESNGLVVVKGRF